MFDLQEQDNTGDWYHKFADDTLYLCPSIKTLMGITGEIKARELLRKLRVTKGHTTLSFIRDASLFKTNYLSEQLEFIYEGKFYSGECWYRMDIKNGIPVGCYGNVKVLKEPIVLPGIEEASTGLLMELSKA
jgi:hypothetical protein